MEERTATSIITDLKKRVAERKDIPRDVWLDAAFDVVILRNDEAKLYNVMHQKVAKEKLEIKKRLGEGGKKVSDSSVEMEIEATESFRLMKDQEDFIYALDELVRVAKKGSDINL